MKVLTELLELFAYKLVSSAETFDPQAKFVAGKNVDGVSIAGINNSFLANFASKTETDIPEGCLQICRLDPSTRASDAVIIHNLLFQANYSLEFSATLFHIWILLADQPNGQDGKLTTADGEKNVFFSLNRKGILMPIQIYWKEEQMERRKLLSGWMIESYPETLPFKKIAGQKIIPVYNKMRSDNDRIFYFQEV